MDQVSYKELVYFSAIKGVYGRARSCNVYRLPALNVRICFKCKFVYC